jgi:hypothetical protein
MVTESASVMDEMADGNRSLVVSNLWEICLDFII